jgi:hypothetical protein
MSAAFFVSLGWAVGCQAGIKRYKDRASWTVDIEIV